MSDETKDGGTKHVVSDGKAEFRGGGYQPVTVQKGYQPTPFERGFQPQSSATPQGQAPQGGTGTVAKQPAASSGGSVEKK